MTDADGNNTTFAYDADGQLLSSTQGAGSAVALTTSETYNADGDIVTTTDGAGHVTSYLYDGDDRVTETIWAAAGVANATSTVTMVYDGLGNVTSMTNQIGTRTTFAYDALDRLTSTTVGGHGHRSDHQRLL